MDKKLKTGDLVLVYEGHTWKERKWLFNLNGVDFFLFKDEEYRINEGGSLTALPCNRMKIIDEDYVRKQARYTLTEIIKSTPKTQSLSKESKELMERDIFESLKNEYKI